MTISIKHIIERFLGYFNCTKNTNSHSNHILLPLRTTLATVSQVTCDNRRYNNREILEKADRYLRDSDLHKTEKKMKFK